jgi:hypothetical protein
MILETEEHSILECSEKSSEKMFACSVITVTKVPEITNRAVVFMQKHTKTTVKAVSLIVIKYSEEFAVTRSCELHRLRTY